MAERTELAWIDLSEGCQAAFEYAVGTIVPPVDDDASESSGREWRVSSKILLLGIASVPTGSAPNPLIALLNHFSVTRAQLNARLVLGMSNQRTHFDPTIARRAGEGELPPITDNVFRAVQGAQWYALEAVHPPQVVPLRFLFGGLLAAREGGAYRNLQSLIADHGGNLAAISDAYGDFLREPFSTGFATFLEARFPTGSGRTFAGYSSDTADGTDAGDVLGRGELAGHLSRWLCARELSTPLAIGLFGDWGSGKSFFMKQLESRIELLRAASAVAEQNGQATSFCTAVRQVTFNAWFHSGSEIWPSLASEVFRAVAGVDRDRVESTDRAFWAKQDPAYRQASDRLEKAAHREAEGRQQIRELASDLNGVRQQIVDDAEKAGGPLGEKLKTAIDTGAALNQAIPFGRRTWVRFVHLPTKTRITIGAASLAVLGLVIWAAVNSSKLTAGLAAVSAVATIVFAGMKTASSLVSELIRADKKRQGLQRELGDAEQGQQAAAQDRLNAERQLEELVRHGALSSYATGQADAWKQREHLSVVAEIRRSFQQLSTLITSSKENSDNGTGEIAPIDRIIVYVDDLDRCEPTLVVQVLEAIKLLMDLPHFIVVVGVDSRWLFRSLEIRFDELISRNGATTDTDTGDWAATPQNYLEKIFQFSLMLPPMTSDGYGRLIEEVFAPSSNGSRAAGGGRTRERDDDPDERATTPDKPVRTGTGLPTAAAPPSDAGPAPEAAAREPQAELSAVGLVLSGDEIAMLRALAPLIETPRSAKRLTNVYRLLRVIVGETPLMTDGSYRIVLVLLGVIVGFPRQSELLLRSIGEQAADSRWSDFVVRITPQRRGDEPYYNIAVAKIDRDDLAVWRRMTEGLKSLQPMLGDDITLGAFHESLPIVSRYAFYPWNGLPTQPSRNVGTTQPAAQP